MYTVTVSGCFEADHSLRMTDGRPEPVHRHTWRVRAAFAGEHLDAAGILVDFTVVRTRIERITCGLNGTFLNDWAALGGRSPSAEHVAETLFHQLSTVPELATTLRAVSVAEAPGCEAAYLGKDLPFELWWTPAIDDKAIVE